eukprot:m.464862 g.464862  ORF g.464862 m.464862 type:complete len:55 (+) comp20358_c0_seq6:161-325(+)
MTCWAKSYFPNSVPKIDGCRVNLAQLTKSFGSRLSQKILEAIVHLGVGVWKARI